MSIHSLIHVPPTPPSSPCQLSHLKPLVIPSSNSASSSAHRPAEFLLSDSAPNSSFELMWKQCEINDDTLSLSDELSFRNGIRTWLNRHQSNLDITQAAGTEQTHSSSETMSAQAPSSTLSPSSNTTAAKLSTSDGVSSNPSSSALNVGEGRVLDAARIIYLKYRTRMLEGQLVDKEEEKQQLSSELKTVQEENKELLHRLSATSSTSSASYTPSFSSSAAEVPQLQQKLIFYEEELHRADEALLQSKQIFQQSIAKLKEEIEELKARLVEQRPVESVGYLHSVSGKLSHLHSQVPAAATNVPVEARTTSIG